MKKMTTLSMVLSKQINVLTASQMSVIKGGTDSSTAVLDPLAAVVASAVGIVSATDDEKRRERPGGGISTH